MPTGQATIKVCMIHGKLSPPGVLAPSADDDISTKRFHDMEAAFAEGDWKLALEICKELETLGVSVYLYGIQVNAK